MISSVTEVTLNQPADVTNLRECQLAFLRPDHGTVLLGRHTGQETPGNPRDTNIQIKDVTRSKSAVNKGENILTRKTSGCLFILRLHNRKWVKTTDPRNKENL